MSGESPHSSVPRAPPQPPLRARPQPREVVAVAEEHQAAAAAAAADHGERLVGERGQGRQQHRADHRRERHVPRPPDDHDERDDGAERRLRRENEEGAGGRSPRPCRRRIAATPGTRVRSPRTRRRPSPRRPAQPRRRATRPAAPLPMSSARTTSPTDHRVWRSTLAAPTLPLPSVRTSTPAYQRPTMNAKGTRTEQVADGGDQRPGHARCVQAAACRARDSPAPAARGGSRTARALSTRPPDTDGVERRRATARPPPPAAATRRAPGPASGAAGTGARLRRHARRQPSIERPASRHPAPACRSSTAASARAGARRSATTTVARTRA